MRELTINDECYHVGSQAFSFLQKVDFLTIKGACFIDENAFSNTSRVHNLNILDSTLDIKHKTFAQLQHVNQVWEIFLFAINFIFKFIHDIEFIKALASSINLNFSLF